MQMPLELSFRGIEDVDIDKDKIRELIQERIVKLEKVCDHIISCHVAIEQPQKHQQSGIPYRVRIDVRVPPNHEIVVNRDPHKGDLHITLPKVIRNAFDVTRRQLQKLVDREHNKVKTHAVDEVIVEG